MERKKRKKKRVYAEKKAREGLNLLIFFCATEINLSFHPLSLFKLNFVSFYTIFFKRWIQIISTIESVTPVFIFLFLSCFISFIFLFFISKFFSLSFFFLTLKKKTLFEVLQRMKFYGFICNGFIINWQKKLFF